jgi:catechol 2,3-dioxygenase-like lactoylglutathione lyase family enzyme
MEKAVGRRGLTARVLAAALLLLLAGAHAAAAAAPGAVQGVIAVGMTVADMERALAFYTGVLPFTKVSDQEGGGDVFERLQGVFPALVRIVRLRLGTEEIVLTDYLAPEGRPIPADMASNDLSFQHIAMIVSDMDRAYAHLRAHGVRHVSAGPQRLPDWNPNAGGIRAFYFRDPDGHVLEILWFPPGKGEPRWQSKDALFLGIDHTAIGVGDTEASLEFYRDALGLRVAGTSENHGIEQERLNAVFGARLRITTLRAEAGPGIEFLHYLAPGPGRAYPGDARANDLVHWQTMLVVQDLAAVEGALRRNRTRFVSPGSVDTRAAGLGFAAALLVRDPDGHAILLVEPEAARSAR